MSHRLQRFARVILRREISRRFNLKTDSAPAGEIERRLCEGVELVGATPWVLMFAIFIASMGLNVNSTAVIIGAMLISPLMGPIMGAGLGLAVYDFALFKRALLNLAIATAISLCVSTLYFAVSPLHEAQSELLARTSPTLWDVLIALFGGLAGVIGMTRQEKSNVIPGVAIATALMPPVCTAGFGLATGQWEFVGGALYLYAINCVFIALATVLGLRALGLPPHAFPNVTVARHVKRMLLAVAVTTALPSCYLAWQLVVAEVYTRDAQRWVKREFHFPNTQVANLTIDPRNGKITVSLVGTPLSGLQLQVLQQRLAQDLQGSHLQVYQAGDNKVDVGGLKTHLFNELYQATQGALQQKESQLFKAQAALKTYENEQQQQQAIAAEIHAQYPQLQQVVVAYGQQFSVTTNTPPTRVLSVQLLGSTPLTTRERTRLHAWLQVRVAMPVLLSQTVVLR